MLTKKSRATVDSRFLSIYRGLGGSVSSFDKTLDLRTKSQTTLTYMWQAYKTFNILKTLRLSSTVSVIHYYVDKLDNVPSLEHDV